jgi:hypothetical protein
MRSISADREVEKLAAGAEAGYDVDTLIARRTKVNGAQHPTVRRRSHPANSLRTTAGSHPRGSDRSRWSATPGTATPAAS